MSILKTVILENREELGKTAAIAAATCIQQLLQTKDYINLIFAAAPSQNEFLSNLLKLSINWERINAFHMDEYVGLSEDAPQGFGNFLRRNIFDQVHFKSVHFINGQAVSAQEECARYTKLLQKFPPDIVLMGIGENTHIAFNDPHVADFQDKEIVKVVDLDSACRQQQVNDGCFSSLVEVPLYAITLTVPILVSAPHIFCMVPGEKKSEAVLHTLKSEISEKYPSTILRTHPNVNLFLDKDSAKLL
ncbi:glucosamine-6-phosphate deaminase [Pedobacter sp. HX-22-1]|uniref:Glucosamine-6-phosphate deaminase n=1 Tax=Pedobacter puniceum TaxID=2666136 RepID=A0A7K0FJN1_9SPHI|nr:glucosamine-6-phosphate deaminase [Pedobacter puniceum]